MDEIDFVLLRTLDETRNVTHAAERLFMTQSAVSKRIMALEEELGCELLVRSRRGVTFTPAGEMALAHTQVAQRELALLRRNIAAYGNEVTGSLTACFSINFASEQLPYVLAQYRASYPRVRLSIRTGRSTELVEQMQKNSADVAVIRGEFGWSGPKELVAAEPVYIVRAREHEGVELSRLPYIDHQTDTAQEQLINRWMRERGLERHPDDIRVDDLRACATLAELGMGWTLLPEIALRDFDGIRDPCAFLDGTPLMRNMYVYWQKDADGLPQVKAFVNLLCHGYGDERAHGEAHANLPE